MGDGAPGAGVIGDEHDLVADVLDDPSVVTRRHFEGLGLELTDQSEQPGRRGAQGQRGEADQVDESDGQPVQGPIRHAALGRPLTEDGVAHVVREDGAHRIAEAQGGGGDGGHLRGHLGRVDFGRLQLGLDRLHVDGDRGLSHPGQRTAQHPQQLVTVGSHRIGPEDERGELGVPLGEHRQLPVGHGDTQRPPQGHHHLHRHLGPGGQVGGGQHVALGQHQVGGQPDEMTVPPGHLELLVRRPQRAEDAVDASGVVFCHDQTLPGSRPGRREPGKPSGTVAGLGSALESGHHLRGLRGRRPHGPGRPSGRSPPQTGLARVPPHPVGGDGGVARAVLRLAVDRAPPGGGPHPDRLRRWPLVGGGAFRAGSTEHGTGRTGRLAAFPNGTFWVLPIAGALIGPAGTAIAALTNAVYAIPNALCIHLMRRDAPIPQRRSTSWLDQSMVLAVVLAWPCTPPDRRRPHRSGS